MKRASILQLTRGKSAKNRYPTVNYSQRMNSYLHRLQIENNKKHLLAYSAYLLDHIMAVESRYATKSIALISHPLPYLLRDTMPRAIRAIAALTSRLCKKYHPELLGVLVGGYLNLRY